MDVWQEVVDVSVNTGVLSKGAANTEGNNTSEDLEISMLSKFVLRVFDASSIALTDKWSTRVTLAGVHTAVLVTGANVLIRVNQNVLGLVPGDTGLIGQNGDVDFIEDFLVTSN